MAAKDAVTKEYMRNRNVFADAFNHLLYEGRQVIDPGRLHVLDPVEIVLPYGEDRAVAPVQKYRDNLKYLTAMEDERAAYLVLGLEAQSELSYAMPVRDMLYDAMQYVRQVENASSSHRAEARRRREERQQRSGVQPGESRSRRITSGEFLGGFHKEDRLLPVITLVVLFSPDPWDGPMSIHEMLSEVEEELLPFIANYRINLISPASLDAAAMDRFHSSLREVLLYIKYSKDKNQLRKLVETDPRYRELDPDAAVVINTVTDTKLKMEEKEGKVNVCIAIEEMRQDSWLEGKRLGEKLGEKRVSLINRLNAILIDTGRIDDLKRATQEPEYQARLIEELLPDGLPK